MIDSIFLALSGMRGHERGLNVISNNITNMNTIAFRGSTVSFADVFVGTMPNGFAGSRQALSGGLDASRTRVDFRPGDRQPTGEKLDLFLNGEGFFVVQEEDGEIRYTRDGNFDFNDDGELVVRGQKTKVMTRDANGQLVAITANHLKLSTGKATTTVAFRENLNPLDLAHTIEALDVFDALGNRHTLRIEFRKDATATGAIVRWNIEVFEADERIGSDTLEFTSISPLGSPRQLQLALAGTEATNISFVFDFPDVTGQSQGSEQTPTQSTLTVREQDGFATGTVTGRTFDEKGILKLTYSNGKTADGPKLALAQISDRNGLVEMGNSRFAYRGTQAVVLRDAGDDLRTVSGALERSNVNLTEEFSELILMQRGYQASSQVLTTANEMLQELLNIKGRR